MILIDEIRKTMYNFVGQIKKKIPGKPGKSGGYTMQYLLLGMAIVFEIIATTLLKASEGFTKLIPAAGCVVFYVLCFYSFSKALLKINLGVAYATWCAGGIVATTIISAVIFGQKLNTVGVIAVVLIAAGCVILNLYGTSGH